jgi:hypothetical protein
VLVSLLGELMGVVVVVEVGMGEGRSRLAREIGMGIVVAVWESIVTGPMGDFDFLFASSA